MIPRRLFRPLLIFCLIFGGSIVGCICERSSRRLEDFDFDLTPGDEPEDTAEDSAEDDPTKTGRN